MSGRGGARPGAGRSVGWRKEEGTRKQHQMRAYDDEWELIQRFAYIVKHGDVKACIDAVIKLETKQ